MYKYTFVLNTGQKDHVVGNTFQSVLRDYFQTRGIDIIFGATIQDIKVVSIPNKKGGAYHVNKKLIDTIVAELKQNNAVLASKRLSVPQFINTGATKIVSAPVGKKMLDMLQITSAPSKLPSAETIQQQRCKEMQETCPPGSNTVDPIMMYEDWCDDVPYKEFVKQDAYISNCYRLSNLINSFVGGLEAEKGGNPMPQWPTDPFNKVAIPVKRLRELYAQALDAKIDIPDTFRKFIKGLDKNVFDIDVAMEGPYIGLTDKINPAYQKGFVEPAIKELFEEEEIPPFTQTQEEKDLQMAIQLAEQFGYQ